MRHVHQYGQWDCWRQSLSTESRKLCGFLGEEFLHEVRIFRACCGEISNFHGNVYYIQYIYIDTWNSENPILIIYIYIYTCSQVLHLNYSHYLYTDIYAQVNSVSMTSHHPPTTKEGLGVLRQQTQEECVLSQDLFAERRADVSDLTSWIWPVHSLWHSYFCRLCGYAYTALHMQSKTWNRRYIHIIYIYTWPNKPTCQPVSGGYGSVITYTKLMISQYFSCIWLFSRFLLYLVERNMCSLCPLFDGICWNF